MTTPPLMRCGCVATGTLADGRPVCTTHVGIVKEAEQVVATEPDLAGRMAYCNQCTRRTASSLSLPFFSYEPNDPIDRYYCGCLGWD